jgi:hypothetical protein
MPSLGEEACKRQEKVGGLVREEAYLYQRLRQKSLWQHPMLEALYIPYVSTSLPPLLEQPQWKRAKTFLRPYESAEGLL